MTLLSVVAMAVLQPRFRYSEHFGEQHLKRKTADEVRYRIDLPADFDSGRPTEVLFFATPNGNTIEQSLGCQPREGLDWHYDIQHIAAQWRTYSRSIKDRNVVLATVQAVSTSWPAWRRDTDQPNGRIRELVGEVLRFVPGDNETLVLSAHSGGGSFLHGYIEAGPIPDPVRRIIFLDANYSFSADTHLEPLKAWIGRGGQFVSYAYDDRNIELDGKKVVGPTGGTWRATQRIVDAFNLGSPAESDQRLAWSAKGLELKAEKNPENKILHTRLVEENGLLAALGGRWEYRGRRAYSEFIQPSPLVPLEAQKSLGALPPREPDAIGGNEFMKLLAYLDRDDQQKQILKEILAGNVPAHMRQLHAFQTRWEGKLMTFWALPDYLAVGSDDDWMRIPMQPKTAQVIADSLGCILPTRRLVDAIYEQADVRLEPQPLTKERESVFAFFQSHQLIEKQRAGRAGSIAGIKKDYVVTNQLVGRSDREAIYGWHWLTGDQIQPITTVHVDWYVDYSHGARLIHQMVDIDGELHKLSVVMANKELWPFATDEGPLKVTRYAPSASSSSSLLSVQ
jgi:hypothetical protein